MRIWLWFGAVAAGALIAASALASAGGPAADADCSQAAALRVGAPYAFDPAAPQVGLALCGEFLGPGSEAMVVTFGAPTCWPVQSWAVFGFREGSWRLVKRIPAYLVPPLVAVGNGIRETTAVHRPGDPRCLPSGGTRARTWRWNGRGLVAGPWRQVAEGAAVTSAAFRSPSGNIECGMGDDRRSRLVECWTFQPPQKAKLYPGGRVTTCRGSAARCRLANIGEEPTLAYGGQITVGRFRCRSMRTGVECTVTRTGRGFLINRTEIRRVGP